MKTRHLTKQEKTLTEVILSLETLKDNLQQHNGDPLVVSVCLKEYHHNLHVLEDYGLEWTKRPYAVWLDSYLTKNSPYKGLFEGNTVHNRG